MGQICTCKLSIKSSNNLVSYGSKWFAVPAPQDRLIHVHAEWDGPLDGYLSQRCIKVWSTTIYSWPCTYVCVYVPTYVWVYLRTHALTGECIFKNIQVELFQLR